MSQDRMIELLDSLVSKEGVIQDIIEGVNLFRITKSTPRSPINYEPSIIILAQGQKKVFIGDEVLIYDPLNYLVLSVPLPLECETTASLEKPMLGITIKVNASLVGEILLAIDDNQSNITSLPKGVYSESIDEVMSNTIIRLLETLSFSKDRSFLGLMIVKEIIYRVLCGNKGNVLKDLTFRNQHFFQIARILDKIHKLYNNKFNLDSLAYDAGMSISLFHSSFKAVTKISPLQYIKNVKLHKAKLLMIEEGINAYEASMRVGYESPSQFNREYKRLFGITPGRDAIHK